MDIASLRLKVETDDLVKGEAALDSLAQQSEKTAQTADNLTKAYKNTGSTAIYIADATDQVNDSLKEQKEEMYRLLASINPVTSAYGKLDEMERKLGEFKGSGLVDADTFEDAANNIKLMRDELAKAEFSRTAEGRAAKEAAKAEQSATAAKALFIEKLREQAELQGKTNAEILAYKANQLGVSNQVTPFIDKLTSQERALDKSKVSAIQYQQALKFLPFQMRTIVTALGNTIPVLDKTATTGGSVSSSFTGTGAAIRSMTALLNPAVIAFGGFIALLGGIAYSYKKGSDEADAFNVALAMTGSVSGKTSAQLAGMAKQISESYGTTGNAAKALAAVVNTGAFKGDQLKMVASAAVGMQEVTGQAIDKTISDFQRLQDDPVKASEELNKQYHYLSASVYEQINALVQQGREQEAAKLATEAYSKAIQERIKEVDESAGYLGKTLKAVSGLWADFWDAAYDVGREESPTAKLDRLNADIAAREKKLTAPSPSKGISQYGYHAQTANGGFFGNDYDKLRQNQESALAALKKERDAVLSDLSTKEEAVKAKAEIQEINDLGTSAYKVMNDLVQSNLSAKEKQIEAERKLNKAIEDNRKAHEADNKVSLFTEQEIAKARAAIQQKNKPTKTAAYKDDLATREMAESQKRLAALREQVDATQALTSEERKLAQFSQQIADIKNKLILTADQKSLLARADEIQSSLKLEAIESRRIDQQKKFLAVQKQIVAEQETQTARLKQQLDMYGLSSKQQQRLGEENQIKATFRQRRQGISEPEKLKVIDGQEEEALQRLHDGYDQLDERQTDWKLGAKAAFAEYGESAMDAYSHIKSISTNAFEGATDTLTDYLTKGKDGFKDFAISIISDLARMTVKMALFTAAKAAIGGTAMGAAMGFSGGGYTGKGGKYDPAGIVHKDEFVFPKESVNRLGVNYLNALAFGDGYSDGGLVTGSSAVAVSVPRYSTGVNQAENTFNTYVTVQPSGNPESSGNQNSDSIGKAYNQVINQSVREGIMRETKPGGIIWRAQQSR